MRLERPDDPLEGMEVCAVVGVDRRDVVPDRGECLGEFAVAGADLSSMRTGGAGRFARTNARTSEETVSPGTC
jgi:hypothetical protein